MSCCWPFVCLEAIKRVPEIERVNEQEDRRARARESDSWLIGSFESRHPLLLSGSSGLVAVESTLNRV